MPSKIAKIAVSSATYWFDKPFDYMIPDELLDQVCVGKRVTAPFGNGNKKCEGIVLSVDEFKGDRKLKFLSGVLDTEAVLSKEMIKLAIWMRERFFCTVYDAVKSMLPAGIWYNLRPIYEISHGIDKESAYELAGRSAKERSIIDIIYANSSKCELSVFEDAFEEKSPSKALSSLVKKGVLTVNVKENRRVKDKVVSNVFLAIPPDEAYLIAQGKKRRSPQQSAVLELVAQVGKVSISEIIYFTSCSRLTIKKLIEQGFLHQEDEEVYRNSISVPLETTPLPNLNDRQQDVFEKIFSLTKNEIGQAALLFGVTGSGKTTIYLRLIEEMLKKDSGSILLVPEIALTPQMIEKFTMHFGGKVAVLHSNLAISERYDEWKRIKKGDATVVIGTRSAVFAPVKNLSLIIIDEEQEEAYKSENTPRYHARDVAKFRCASQNALLLLGSATPDVESRYFAQNGRYNFYTMPERFNNQDLPIVQIVDLKKELKNGNGSSISSVLQSEIELNLEKNEQTILFINRRGTSKLISCSECGFTYVCTRCSANMTYHSANSRLMCHYCGYSKKPDSQCPDCGGLLNFTGAGTQQVVADLEILFPDVEILRMDTDTVAPSGSHELLLNKFRDEKIPIMVGTQMVTKGLNFDNVTLVGVISADQSLYSGNYRSSERTFSLITQVVGRSGRGSKKGRAVIQTMTPENQTIIQAANQDYEGFYNSEIYMREMQWVPPFTDIYSITVTGTNEALVMRCCVFIRDSMKKETSNKTDMKILGPAPLPIVKINNRFRYCVTLCGDEGAYIRKLISNMITICNTSKDFKGVSVFADINPL